MGVCARACVGMGVCQSEREREQGIRPQMFFFNFLLALLGFDVQGVVCLPAVVKTFPDFLPGSSNSFFLTFC